MNLAVLVAANIITEDMLHFGLIEPWAWHCVAAAGVWDEGDFECTGSCLISFYAYGAATHG